MISSSTLPLIAAVLTLTGFIAGVLVMLVVNERRKNKSAASAANSRDTLYKEVVRLWHERSSGRLFVEVNERMLAESKGLGDAQRAEQAAAARDWLKWLGYPGGVAAEPAPPPIPAAVSAPAPTPPLPADPAAKPAIETARKTSIVEQIDAILQEKLADSALADKGIRLTEEPQHGVAVWVGLQRYAGIDAVPDAEIVKLIRASAAEWERQNSAERN